VWYIHADCNFYTHYDFETHECDYDPHDCDFNTHKSDLYTQSVILTSTSVITTRRLRFPPTHWEFDTHECVYDTHNCDFNTHMSGFYTQSVILTRMSVIMTLNYFLGGNWWYTLFFRLIFKNLAMEAYIILQLNEIKNSEPNFQRQIIFNVINSVLCSFTIQSNDFHNK
jgi:hypothetical protein